MMITSPELNRRIEGTLDELIAYLDPASREQHVQERYHRAQADRGNPAPWRDLAQALRDAADLADALADLTATTSPQEPR
ncbi:hypothetical protein [Spirillospora sp. CA-294931]|uniref:hypothetical protein n=1 Tax=Spirillospora sp. CA-294931 TaxID=3240042 RepID=UPI003D8B2967